MSISNGANDNEDDDYEEDYVESSLLRQSSRDSEEDIPDIIPWEDYFHGDMDRQAAKSQLKAFFFDLRFIQTYPFLSSL